VISGCRRPGLALAAAPYSRGAVAGPPPGSSVPRRATQPADHESNMHIPMPIGESTITTEMKGKS
jgi:hypothetical protein